MDTTKNALWGVFCLRATNHFAPWAVAVYPTGVYTEDMLHIGMRTFSTILVIALLGAFLSCTYIGLQSSMPGMDMPTSHIEHISSITSVSLVQVSVSALLLLAITVLFVSNLFVSRNPIVHISERMWRYRTPPDLRHRITFLRWISHFVRSPELPLPA